MQSLLRWSIENSTPQQDGGREPATQQQKLDTGIIDMILGRSDAEQMKEDVSAASDRNKNEDERLAALDHLEMLVEQIDNANDLEKLGLWPTLISLLDSAESSTEIKVLVLWVIGTAIQNNPQAQDVYLSYNPLPGLFGKLTLGGPSTSEERAKAVYTLSGLLKHNGPAVKELERPDVEGWIRLKEALQDPDISVRRKVEFLLQTLVLEDESTESGAGVNERIHVNSHAAHLWDRSRSETRGVALAAYAKYGIVI